MTRQRVLTISALAILPFFLTGCGLKKNNTGSKASPTPSISTAAVVSNDGTITDPATATLLTIDPSSIDASVADHLAQADAKTKNWRSNALLAHVSIKIPADFAVGQSTETYTYGSESDGFNWWTVTISGKTNKMVRALIPKEDFLGTGYPAIPKQYWKINYVEALQLADVNGGSEFRSTHPDTEVVANLAVSEPKNYLWWNIEYKSGTTVKRIFVNPASKEVVDEQGNPLTSAAQTATTPSPSSTSSATLNPTTQSTPSDDEVLEE